MVVFNLNNVSMWTIWNSIKVLTIVYQIIIWITPKCTPISNLSAKCGNGISTWAVKIFRKYQFMSLFRPITPLNLCIQSILILMWVCVSSCCRPKHHYLHVVIKSSKFSIIIQKCILKAFFFFWIEVNYIIAESHSPFFHHDCSFDCPVIISIKINPFDDVWTFNCEIRVVLIVNANWQYYILVSAVYFYSIQNCTYFGSMFYPCCFIVSKYLVFCFCFLSAQYAYSITWRREPFSILYS